MEREREEKYCYKSQESMASLGLTQRIIESKNFVQDSSALHIQKQYLRHSFQQECQGEALHDYDLSNS